MFFPLLLLHGHALILVFSEFFSFFPFPGNFGEVVHVELAMDRTVSNAFGLHPLVILCPLFIII